MLLQKTGSLLPCPSESNGLLNPSTRLPRSALTRSWMGRYFTLLGGPPPKTNTNKTTQKI